MTPATVIDVQLYDAAGENALHLRDVYVDFRFFLKRRYCYGFRFGPTDPLGHLRVGYDEIEADRLNQLAKQPWDFKTRLEECDSAIRVLILSARELANAYEAVAMWEGDLVKAERWLLSRNAAIRARPVDIVAAEGITSVRICCTEV